MKKIFFSVLTFMFTFSFAFSQSIDNARLYAAAKKYDEAKNEIDQVTATEKNGKNPDALYLKTQIYAMLALDSISKAKYPTARETALESFKKYLTVDPKYKVLKADNYNIINNLYAIYFNDGALQYNQKKYVEATNSFQQAVWLSDEMIKNKWNKLTLDTNAILYAGISAQNAKKEDEAVAMYVRLADQKIKAEGYQGIYEFIVDYYRRKKDDANFQKYLAIGEQLYPEDAFWLASKMEVIREKGDFNALITSYENMITQKPSYDLYLELGTTLYDYLYPKDTSKNPQQNNIAAFEQKMVDAYNKAADIKKDAGVPYFSIGNHYYNKAVAVNKLYNVVRNKKTPEEVKKRDELIKQSNTYIDQAIEAYEKACDRFNTKTNATATEKFCHKNSVSALIDLNKDRKTNFKPTMPEYKKYDDAEKKWIKEFDRLDKIR